MKKLVMLVLSGICFSGIQAQDISDAVRFSQDNLNGTARFRAMAGAFGALGGDLSSISVNPAGSAVFVNNQIGFTVSSYNATNNSTYFGSRTSENDYTFDLNQAGVVLVFKNPNNDWRNFTIGLTYENTNNFNNTLFSAGTSPQNSISQYFTSFANQNGGVPLSTLENAYYEDLDYAGAQAFLGYQGYLINPVEDGANNSQYVSNIPAGGNYYQENAVVSRGYNGKLSFNGAAQYRDRIFIGLNLNSHFVDYRQSSRFFESNSNDAVTGVQRTIFNSDLYTYGSGFSFQLGAIAKVTDGLRVGAAYESPTWYRLYDELSQNLSSLRLEDGQPLESFVDPRITIAYDPYKLKTPGKWTGSLAYVFGKSGVISADYSMKDYGTTRFRPESDFMNTNDAMSNALGQSAELRIGGEYRVKQWSFRAGYRMEESPYENSRILGDLTGYSGGLGYNFGSTRLDLAYSYTERDSAQPFFSQGFTNAADINTINNNVSLSLLFEL